MFIKIKVKTGSRQEQVRKISEDLYEVDLREEAENNAANDRLVAIFRELYKGAETGRTSIRIVKGHHSPHKIISVETK